MQVSKAKKGYKLVDTGFGKFEEIPEEWEFKRLEEISEIVGGGTPDSNNEEFWNGDVLWAVPTDITKLSSKFIENTKRRISQRGLEKSSAKLLPVGTILITSRATIGECAIAKKPISTNQGFQNLICNENNFNQFWYYAIQFHKNKLLKLCNATTFLEISKNNMKKILIESPTLKSEQQKIATILSNIDTTLKKTNQLIEKIEILKKGLMQKLFTKGIDHTKFKKTKIGELPEEWDIMKLNSVCSKITDGTHHSPPSNLEGDFLYITAKNIKHYGINLDNVTYIQKKIHSEIYSRCNPEKNDVLYIKDGVTTGIATVNELEEQFSLLSSVALIKPNHKKLDSYFLKYYLNYKKTYNRIIQSLVGSAITRLTLVLIKSIDISLPSLSEQQKIATILLNVDSQINKEKLNKSNLEILKKGLMQKLLTGQIRVKV